MWISSSVQITQITAIAVTMQVKFIRKISSIKPLLKPSHLIIVCTLFINNIRGNFLNSRTCSESKLVNYNKIIVIKKLFKSGVPQHSSWRKTMNHHKRRFFPNLCYFNSVDSDMCSSIAKFNVVSTYKVLRNSTNLQKSARLQFNLVLETLFAARVSHFWAKIYLLF